MVHSLKKIIPYRYNSKVILQVIENGIRNCCRGDDKNCIGKTEHIFRITFKHNVIKIKSK